MAILVDLMYTTARDFIIICRGESRNLSVIGFRQYLYYNKDPTQRQNYLVMHNNPGERCKSWLWLDRCISRIPNTVETLKKVSSKPNGYPLIDLTPTTSDNLRLRTCVLFSIKSSKTGNIAHYFEKGHSSQTHLKLLRSIKFGHSRNRQKLAFLGRMSLVVRIISNRLSLIYYEHYKKT